MIPNVKHFPPLVHICPITVYNVAMFGGGHMLQLYVSVCVGGCAHASVEQGAVRYYTSKAMLYFTKYRHINKPPWATV